MHDKPTSELHFDVILHDCAMVRYAAFLNNKELTKLKNSCLYTVGDSNLSADRAHTIFSLSANRTMPIQ
jgi:hypothetical protein